MLQSSTITNKCLNVDQKQTKKTFEISGARDKHLKSLT